MGFGDSLSLPFVQPPVVDCSDTGGLYNLSMRCCVDCFFDRLLLQASWRTVHSHEGLCIPLINYYIWVAVSQNCVKVPSLPIRQWVTFLYIKFGVHTVLVNIQLTLHRLLFTSGSWVPPSALLLFCIDILNIILSAYGILSYGLLILFLFNLTFHVRMFNLFWRVLL